MHHFTNEQIEDLKKKLDPKHVATRKQANMQLSYIEGWHAIAEANRIFGFDGWTRETVELTENTDQPTKNDNDKFVVSFRARVRVRVGDIVREGVGFGSGIAKSVHDAYEGAVKEAETDAMKRALMTFGNQFGLALYDKNQSNVGIDEPILEGEQYADLLNQISEAVSKVDLIEATKNRKAMEDKMSTEQKNALINASNKKLAVFKSAQESVPAESTVQ